MHERFPTTVEERGGLYYLLARLLSHPPDAEVMRDVKSLGWEVDEKELEALQVEFTRLFSAPTPESIPMHQSIYTDLLKIEASGPDPTGCGLAFGGGSFHGYLGGESCSEVSRFYRNAGFVPFDPAPAMADHVSTELACVGCLYLMEERSLKKGMENDAKAWRELREIFGSTFLGRWIQEFTEKVASNPVSAFYRRVGHELRLAAIHLHESAHKPFDESHPEFP